MDRRHYFLYYERRHGIFKYIHLVIQLTLSAEPD